MSVGIVDVLQSVQIGRNDDHAHVLSLALRQLLPELAVETAAVQKSGHMVVHIQLFQFAVDAFQLHIDGFGVHLGMENPQCRTHGIHEAVDLFVGIIGDVRLECTVAHGEIQKMQGTEDHRIFPFQQPVQIGDQCVSGGHTGLLRAPEVPLAEDVDIFTECLFFLFSLAEFRSTEQVVIQGKDYGVEDEFIQNDLRQFRQ